MFIVRVCVCVFVCVRVSVCMCLCVHVHTYTVYAIGMWRSEDNLKALALCFMVGLKLQSPDLAASTLATEPSYQQPRQFY